MQKTIEYSRSYKENWARQSTNLFFADLIGSSSEALTVANMEKVERAFPTVTASLVGALTPVMSAFQGPIEYVLDHAKNFEGEKYQLARKERTAEERAHGLAHSAIHYGVPIAVGWGATIQSEKLIRTYIHKAPPITKGFWAADMGIHLGLVAVMGMPFMGGFTEKAKDIVCGISKVFGADEDQAEDIARLAVVSALPNYATLGVVSGMMYRNQKKLAEQLNISSALSHT